MLESIATLEKQVAILQRKIEREIGARKQAEKILECKSLELFERNKDLEKVNEQLDEKVLLRTRDLQLAKEDAVSTMQALQSSLSRLELVLTASGAHLWEKNLLTGEFFCSDELPQLLGMEKPSLDKLSAQLESFPFINAHDTAKLRNALKNHLKGGSCPNVECRIRLASGEERWYRINILILSKNDRIERIVGSLVDVHDKVQSRQTIEHMAMHDTLTAVPNRAFFTQRLHEAYDRFKENGENFALLIIDLNDFKEINDRYGHQAGDQLLQHIATNLTHEIKGYDTVARLGGDEFALILRHITDRATVRHICNLLISACEKPTVFNHTLIQARLSIGIAMASTTHHSEDELIANADIAMYHAKHDKQEGSHAQFFEEQLREGLQATRALKSRLDEAIEERAFSLYYQPKIELGTGKIAGVEALIRWFQADGTMIPPSDFIPLAEETGQIKLIGKWVINECCQQIKQWQQRGMPIPIAFNLSPEQFCDDTITSFIEQAVEYHQINTRLLEVEITEGSIVQNLKTSRTQLDRLHEMGIRISLDDFGTGYSNLRYLNQLPIDVLKIDRAFITNVDQQGDSQLISQAIIRLGQSLGMKIVAEGVETVSELDWLKAQQCDIVQGYFYSRPVPAEELTALAPRFGWVDYLS